MSFSLYLFANQSTDITISSDKLIELLLDIGFLDIAADQQRYLPAPLLMDYITFLGCSPSLKMGKFESVIRLFQYDKLTGMGGNSIESIKYPGCKHPVDRPSQLLADFSIQPEWLCPVCGQMGNTQDINWRKTAGFSRIFIEISNIFPKEAVPSDKLLTALKRNTGTEWQWFYSKTSA